MPAAGVPDREPWFAGSQAARLIMTLKHRTVSPVVERFIAVAREVAKSLADSPPARKAKDGATAPGRQ